MACLRTVCISQILQDLWFPRNYVPGYTKNFSASHDTILVLGCGGFSRLPLSDKHKSTTASAYHCNPNTRGRMYKMFRRFHPNIFQIYITMHTWTCANFPLQYLVSGRLCILASSPRNNCIWSLQHLVRRHLVNITLNC